MAVVELGVGLMRELKTVQTGAHSHIPQMWLEVSKR